MQAQLIFRIATEPNSVPVTLNGASTFTFTFKVDGDTSDGYHTFNELYEHRHALFLVVCKTYKGWKSKKHAANKPPMYDGFFIAGVETPSGVVSYHLPLEWWDRYECEEREEAPRIFLRPHLHVNLLQAREIRSLDSA